MYDRVSKKVHFPWLRLTYEAKRQIPLKWREVPGFVIGMVRAVTAGAIRYDRTTGKFAPNG